VYFIV